MIAEWTTSMHRYHSVCTLTCTLFTLPTGKLHTSSTLGYFVYKTTGSKLLGPKNKEGFHFDQCNKWPFGTKPPKKRFKSTICSQHNHIASLQTPRHPITHRMAPFFKQLGGKKERERIGKCALQVWQDLYLSVWQVYYSQCIIHNSFSLQLTYNRH